MRQLKFQPYIIPRKKPAHDQQNQTEPWLAKCKCQTVKTADSGSFSKLYL